MRPGRGRFPYCRFHPIKTWENKNSIQNKNIKKTIKQVRKWLRMHYKKKKRMITERVLKHILQTNGRKIKPV